MDAKYQWNIKKCACDQACFKSQEDCGNPNEYKLNTDTCECEKNCETRDCGLLFMWGTEMCRCILILLGW